MSLLYTHHMMLTMHFKDSCSVGPHFRPPWLGTIPTSQGTIQDVYTPLGKQVFVNPLVAIDHH